MIRFQCGKCGKKLGIADTEAGLAIKCPGCGTKLRVPGERKGGPPAAPVPKPPPRKPIKREEAEAETEEIPQIPGGQDFVEVEPVEEPPPRKAIRKPRRDEEEEAERLEEDDEPRPAKGKAKRRRAEEDEDEDEEEEERRPRSKAKRRGREEEDEEDEDFDDEDEEKPLITPNRIRGVVAVLGAGGVTAAALLIEKFQDPDFVYIKYVIFGIAGLMLVAGIYYLIKG